MSSVLSLNNMDDLLTVERLAFQNLPDMVKLELSNNPQLSYIHPQAFRCGTRPLSRPLRTGPWLSSRLR